MHNIDLLIIESQLQRDIDQGFKEGQVLRDVLAHDGLAIGYRHVSSRAQLSNVLKDFSEEIRSKNKSRIPAIHIAAHGHDDAMSLTDGDQIPWIDFWKMFMFFADDPIILIGLSTCEGMHSTKIAQGIPKLPVAFLVGSDENIIMGDSLIGFSIFYHLLIKKELDIDDAIDSMNKGINANVFQSKLISSFEDRS